MTDMKNENSSSQTNPAKGVGNGVPQLDPAMTEKIAQVRSKVHETFGKVALAMMALPRYRHLSLLDLNAVLLEPLIRDRVAIASSTKSETGEASHLDTLSGIAIWASVSEDVDQKIREQIKAGVFPLRLAADDWNSGSIHWLFDVIAPNERLTTSVIANFKQVVKEGDLRIHPLITRLVDPETLKKMGAAPVNAKKADA
ncbi:toxin-activating lysine-acyltransferase [Stappia taiwanensis]|nr:toxin-activating lysine-acyltransferase [Stappia taiwanensis]